MRDYDRRRATGDLKQRGKENINTLPGMNNVKPVKQVLRDEGVSAQLECHWHGERERESDPGVGIEEKLFARLCCLTVNWQGKTKGAHARCFVVCICHSLSLSLFRTVNISGEVNTLLS